jgi:sialate O-acetylesterase
LGVSAWAALREAQAMALSLPKTAMAVTLDIGERGDIHPHNKHDVGRRLALQTLKVVYGKDVIASGPVFRKMIRQDRILRVTFANASSGLVTVDGMPPKGFTIAGADRAWRWADARIEREEVAISSPDVPEPVAVRYGWANDPPNTLRNHADLPAAPFRTDDWPAAPPVLSVESR